MTTSYLLRHDPALLAERLKLLPVSRDQKPWDRVIMALFFVAGVTLFIVPGLDVVRYGWSEPLPLWVRVSAFVVQVPCLAGLNWIVRENTWLAQVVKIDEARHQQVITTGPYALVRHPMYTVTIVLVFAIPAALGSRYALLLSLFLTALLIMRTWLEDRTLHAELEGYSDYARQTRYRLIPGIW
ncbi:MAG: isoprenylcysteine carboxylmethyltransferase family protein [Chlorobiaceae bacterium]|nr:isoprenylcysteine carboxylmethyltransferase family protein [Chlorobiaceae bacterium]